MSSQNTWTPEYRKGYANGYLKAKREPGQLAHIDEQIKEDEIERRVQETIDQAIADELRYYARRNFGRIFGKDGQLLIAVVHLEDRANKLEGIKGLTREPHV